MNSEIKVIKPSGILDSSSATQVCHEVNNCVNEGFKFFLIDMEAVTFIDSSGLGGVVNAFKTVRSAGGKLVLCSVNDQARMLLEITGMDQIFDIFLNQEAFSLTLLKTA